MSFYRVYYSDGSTYEGPNPPAWDVQAILQRNEEGQWVIRSGGDFYTFRDGVWTEHDFIGLIDFLQDTGIVLFGRTVSNTKFADVMAQAMKDREEIEKNG